MTSQLRRIMICATLISSLALCGVDSKAVAGEFPDRPLKLVVPFPPGGATDSVARNLSERLAKGLKQPVIIENKPGANGAIGAESVSRAVPDGHTFLWATQASLVLNPLLSKRLSYDPRDLSPLTIVTDVPLVIVVHPSVPANTLTEFVAYARENGDRLNYGSAGVGNLLHIAVESFKLSANINMTHVPYRGNGPALQDLLAGHVQVMFDVVGTSLPHIQTGNLRALAVTTSERLALLPDTPTVAESGYPDYRAVGWFGVATPKGVPAGTFQRLTVELDEVLMDAEFRGSLEKLGYVVHRPRDADGIAKFIEEDRARWSKLITQQGISIN